MRRHRLALTLLAFVLVASGVYFASDRAPDPAFLAACATDLGSASVCRCIGRRLMKDEAGVKFAQIVAAKHAFTLYAHMPDYTEASMRAMQPCL